MELDFLYSLCCWHRTISPQTSVIHALASISTGYPVSPGSWVTRLVRPSLAQFPSVHQSCLKNKRSVPVAVSREKICSSRICDGYIMWWMCHGITMNIILLLPITYYQHLISTLFLHQWCDDYYWHCFLSCLLSLLAFQPKKAPDGRRRPATPKDLVSVHPLSMILCSSFELECPRMLIIMTALVELENSTRIAVPRFIAASPVPPRPMFWGLVIRPFLGGMLDMWLRPPTRLAEIIARTE